LVGIITFASCQNNQEITLPTIRNTVDLTELEWKLWLDSAALWQNDSLCLSPVDLMELPVNPPSCGWDELYGSKGIDMEIPATVEQYYWNDEKDNNGTGGDYKGVSWFTTSMNVPYGLKGKRVILDFESVRLRAEVFVNEQLAGYDCIGNTPFQVDITNHLEYGAKNRLSIRITDPSGNFDWGDYHLDRWGSKYIPPSHGFGGITGKICMFATDSTFISNVFIKNTPSITKIDAEISLHNLDPEPANGKLVARVFDADHQNCLLVKELDVVLSGTDGIYDLALNLPDASPWSPDAPFLYYLDVEWKGNDGSADQWRDRFGFRWFEIRENDGDRQLYLNDQRIFLTSAITWGFWPSNGIFPSKCMAEKQVSMAKDLGLNMLNFHRAIGEPRTIEAADEMGLLLYEEPGGYRSPQHNIWFWDLHGDSNSISREDISLAWEWRRAKLMRMIKRDRNHPSMVIYCMQNEILHDPDEFNKRDIRDAHRMDPTRIIVYSSNAFEAPYMQGYNGYCPETPAEAKMYMEPYDDEIKFQGWWDEHNAPGPGTYIDKKHYSHPGYYYHNTDHKSEIIFYGEEGSIGGPSRLTLIKQTILENNLEKGWDGTHYIRSSDALEEYLNGHAFTNKNITIDDYITSMGNVPFYYQGRIIENCRINNNVDGYVINGWESSKISNFSGMVDIYRNPKGDPALLAHYNQPAYVAVKLRNKVLPGGAGTMADIYAVNQKNIAGAHSLIIRVNDETGLLAEKQYDIDLAGGNQFGQLLVDGMPINPRDKSYHGYIHVKAVISNENEEILAGSDELFVVGLDPGKIKRGQVLDESGLILNHMKNSNRLSPYTSGKPYGRYLILGSTTKPKIDVQVMNWIKEGNKLLIVHDADKWMEAFGEQGIISYQYRKDLDSLWFGGHFFVREHELFKDLPVNTAFNWEYQVFSRYTAERYGLILEGAEAVVGAISKEDIDIATAVGIIPYGNGEIIFSTLDILPILNSNEEAAAVARKVLINYLEYASN
jgi:hypothetical protein